jgi:hypothetical protein
MLYLAKSFFVCKRMPKNKANELSPQQELILASFVAQGRKSEGSAAAQAAKCSRGKAVQHMETKKCQQKANILKERQEVQLSSLVTLQRDQLSYATRVLSSFDKVISEGVFFLRLV